ncbi:DUF956 family protein [Oenococcus alcoholitolerans]|uniref:DUF956 family protein n=1 Tax=Oenococcus alcoholitolerans TaxID=931074 RepID=UPI003F7273CB
MVQSINTKVDLVAESTSYMGLGQYGKVMIGDRGFEFYDDSNPRNYIQIPWEEVDVVIASLMFGGKWIPRYAISTKKNGIYKFSSRHPKVVLRAIRVYIDPNRIVRSLTFFQVFSRDLKWLFGRIFKKKTAKNK